MRSDNLSIEVLLNYVATHRLSLSETANRTAYLAPRRQAASFAYLLKMLRMGLVVQGENGILEVASKNYAK